MAKWIVVGAGLTGATLAERIATVRGEEVRVVERRPYVGGAAADYVIDEGLLVQRCGPHVFHTESPRLWNYLEPFSDWRPFRYQVSAYTNGSFVPLPVGFRGIDILFPEKASAVKMALTDRFEVGQKVSIHKLLKEPEPLLHEVACTIYDTVFRWYTMKQWGIQPEALDPSVLARVPIVIGDQDSYTGDRIQAVPTKGFTHLVSRMLDHPKITVDLQSDYDPQYPAAGYNVLYSGAIDEFFRYECGSLPYRSVCFDLQVLQQEHVLPVPTVTYPNSMPYTRATDMKQVTGQAHALSAVVYEYPTPCRRNMPPYYPVPTTKSRELYLMYARRAETTDVRFCGRLGEYRYYNMDQAVASALALFERL